MFGIIDTWICAILCGESYRWAANWKKAMKETAKSFRPDWKPPS